MAFSTSARFSSNKIEVARLAIWTLSTSNSVPNSSAKAVIIVAVISHSSVWACAT